METKYDDEPALGEVTTSNIDGKIDDVSGPVCAAGSSERRVLGNLEAKIFSLGDMTIDGTESRWEFSLVENGRFHSCVNLSEEDSKIRDRVLQRTYVPRKGNIILGKEGAEINLVAPTITEGEDIHGKHYNNVDSLGRYSGVDAIGRDAKNLNWHGLDSEVSLAAQTPCTLEPEDSRMESIVELACSSLDKISRTWVTNEKILVVAGTSMENECTRVHPSDIVQGATRGLIFCSNIRQKKFKVKKENKFLSPGEEGWVYCPACKAGCIVGESGPHAGRTVNFCEHDCAAGDHKINPNFLFWPGETWTSRSEDPNGSVLIDLDDLERIQSYGLRLEEVEVELDVHPAWDVILLPVNQDEGRLCANSRLLALTRGRSDVDVIISNAWERKAKSDILVMADKTGLPYFTYAESTAPVCCSSFFSRGALFCGSDETLKKLLVRHGTKYGVDEEFLIKRNPVCIPDLNHYWRHGWRKGVIISNVTFVEVLDGEISRCHLHAVFTQEDCINELWFRPVEDAEMMSQGVRKNVLAVNNQLYLDIENSRNNAVAQAIVLNGVSEGYNMKYAKRRGQRNAKTMRVTKTGRYVNSYGIIWRSNDVAEGLRSCLDCTSTQSLHPELWEEAKRLKEKDVSRFMFNELTKACDIMTKYIEEREKGSMVFVASVYNKSMMDEFKTKRGHLCDSWIFLSERPLEVEEEDLNVVLPTNNGTGFVFQLARLLPFCGKEGSDVLISCVNDLETDHIPRKERLIVGLKGLQTEDIVFPAMWLNCPCPFQDVVGFQGSLARLKENLIASIAKWGWVYGFDEVWACAHDLATIEVRPNLGGAAVENFSNPMDAKVYKIQEGVLKYTEAPKGNFSKSYRRSWERVTTYSPKYKAAGEMIERLTGGKLGPKANGSRKLIDAMTKGTIPLDAWNDRYAAVVNCLHQCGEQVIVAFVWGTRGDRVPIEAAVKMMRKVTQKVFLVELCTVEEGLNGLKLCESERGQYLLPKLFQARRVLIRCQAPFIYPGYFGKLEKGLGYVLRPPSEVSTRPRGGLPKWIDWILDYIQFEAEDIWVGYSRKWKYFPRSHNGEHFLKKQVRPKRPESAPKRKVVVTGSSSVPIPDKYKDWPILERGDHLTLLKDYDVVACAGGSGVVQTAKAAGVEQVISWTNVIDRRWNDFEDAGKGLEGNQNEKDWFAVVFYFFPILLLKFWLWRPGNIYKTFGLLSKKLGILKKAWGMVFMIFCLRKDLYIMPTFEATIGRLILGKTSGFSAVFFGWALFKTLKWTSNVTGRWRLAIQFELLLNVVSVVISPAFMIMTSLGMPFRSALIFAFLWKHFPSLEELVEDVTFSTPSINKPGIWLGLSVVQMGWIPVGFHARIYDSMQETVYEGVMQGDDALGGQFYLQKRHDPTVRSFIWCRTNLYPDDLPEESGDSQLYSALWNCQIIAAELLVKHYKKLPGIIFLLLFTGVFSAWFMLTIVSMFAIFAASTSLVGLAALRITGLYGDKIDAWSKEIKSILTFRLPRFGMDQNMDEDEALTRLYALGLTSGVDEQTLTRSIAGTHLVLNGHEGLRQARPEAYFNKSEPEPILNLTELIVRYCLVMGIPIKVIETLGWMISSIIFVADFSLFTPTTIVIGWLLSLFPGTELGKHVEKLLSLLEEHLFSNKASRKKNAWMPRPKGARVQVSETDLLASAMAEDFEVVGQDDPLQWQIEFLNSLGKEKGLELTQDKHIRPMFLPSRPRVSAREIAEFTTLQNSINYQICPLIDKRTREYEKKGHPQGTDGVWFSDDKTREDEIIRRYVSEPHPYTNLQHNLMVKTTDMLYEKHKEAFEQPGLVRPEVVLKNMVKKYSPGLPFIPSYRRRSQLLEEGWMDTIIQGAYKLLEEGKCPPSVFHAFPKSMITTKHRMVTAQDLLSTFVTQVATYETSKRSIWDIASFGGGAPMSSRFFSQIFEMIEKRDALYEADVTEFDSNCPQVLYAGLARLYKLGVGSNGVRAVANLARAKYVTLQKSKIIDVLTGKQYDKNRGGATGQSTTSWDNHWAFRIYIIMCWSYATGIEPARFYDYVDIHNTGDDDVIGSDVELDAVAFKNASEKLFGMKLKIIRVDGVEKLTYLSRRPIKIKEHLADAKLANMQDCKYGVRFDENRMFLRRSANIARWSQKPQSEYAKHLIQRTIGHLMNSHFNHELYCVLIREYIEEAELYLGVSPNMVMWHFHHLPDGRLDRVEVDFRKNVRPSKLIQNRMKRLKKNMKAPSYSKVMKVTGKELKLPVALSKYKIARVDPSEKIFRRIVQNSRAMLWSAIPTFMTKLAVRGEKAPYSPLFWTPGWPVEKFLYIKLYKENPELELTEFSAACRQSPFSPCVDTTGFWWFVHIPGVREKILKEDEETINGRIYLAYLFYIFWNMVVSTLRKVPYVSILMELFLAWTTDLSRIYAGLSSLYWVSTKEISTTLSSLMPRDPFLTIKKLCVLSSCLFPDQVHKFLAKIWPNALINYLVRFIGMYHALRGMKQAEEAYTGKLTNTWRNFVEEPLSHEGPCWVKSPTASGKSTGFAAAVCEIWQGRVWLILPRKILRQQYQNPFMDRHKVQALSRGITDEGRKLTVCTYGHLHMRLQSLPASVLEGSLFLLDEFHEALPEMGIVFHQLRGRKVFALSATPGGVYGKNLPIVEIPIERPYEEPPTVRHNLSVENLVMEALKRQVNINRMLVIVTGINHAGGVARMINDLGRKVTVVCSAKPTIPSDGDIVATQVVDSGIDIPGVDVVVDCGRAVRQHQGVISVDYTDKLIEAQRRGRTGRRREGMYYTTHKSGSGPSCLVYPSYTLLMGLGSARGWLLGELGIGDKYLIYPDSKSSKIDKRMSLKVFPLTTEVETSLSFWWMLVCAFDCTLKAETTYDSVIKFGWQENTEPYAFALSMRVGSTGILPRRNIKHIIKENPFYMIHSVRGEERVSRVVIRFGNVHGCAPEW